MGQILHGEIAERGGREVLHSFELSGVSIETVFNLLCDPRRLNEMTPPWFQLTVSGALAEPLRPGSTIDYRFRWRRVPLPWRSVITEHEPPNWLVYEQLRGPFRHFRHEHLFEPTDQGVVITDRILYRARGGSWIERHLVTTDLERILRYRETAARRVLAGTP